MGWRSGLVALLGAVLLTAGVVFALSTPDEEPSRPRPEATPEPSTLASYDLTGVTVVRGPFCDRVSPTGIEHALGDVPADSEEWTNGDLERLPDGTRDRVQEFGCRWTAADGTEASAWVFAPPITPTQARDLVRVATAERCSTTAGNRFGRPSVATRCTDRGATQDAYHGLFGDAWLTCALAVRGEPVDLPERTDAWCVAVLEATRS